METRIIKSDVDELPAIKAKLNKNAYAIVIGIEQYRQKLPKADYAVADAKIMAEYLTKVMGYPEENVVTLTNDRASLTDFIKYFEKWLPNNVEKIVLYLSTIQDTARRTQRQAMPILCLMTETRHLLNRQDIL